MPGAAPHVPVLLGPLLAAVAPVRGTWVDGTFGAGGYARGLLDAGADRVIGIDRDPSVFAMARAWAGDHGDRLRLVEGTFSDLDTLAGGPVDGVVLDLGVSSMQLDQPERGFSFLRDGPLDMRMGGGGPSAADLLNTADEGRIADVLYHYGEERAARRIARAIVRARPLTRTGELAAVVRKALGHRPHDKKDPATRTFQAIRIHVNRELGELADGLAAAERLLKPGGRLAVVTFHSLEDRIVKRFLRERSGSTPSGSRHMPAQAAGRAPSFESPAKPVRAGEAELARNPRARSATLRTARRTAAAAWTEAGVK